MSVPLLIDNQSYKKKIVFYNADDNDKRVTITIGLSCNHEINKELLQSIENCIQGLFINNYISEEAYIVKKNKVKEEIKLAKQLEKKVKVSTIEKSIVDYKKRIGVS
jgi:hypothetical protein